MGLIRIYLTFFGLELIRPLNYMVALIIGVVIDLGLGHHIFNSPIPYVIPLLVQSFFQSILKFRTRNRDCLLQLYRERTDPAFIMNAAGRILASTGNTRALLKELGIENIGQLLDQATCRKFLARCEQPGEVSWKEEAYSPALDKWYRVKAKKMSRSTDVLVWFEDITERKNLDTRLATIRNFSIEIRSSLPDLVVHDDSSERLARLILMDGYAGVFITESDQRGDLSGRVYKMQDGRLLTSVSVRVSRTSPAPIWLSRSTARVVSAERSDYDSTDEFEKAHPFDNRVKEFLNFPLYNFINYHEEEISIIAFNKEHRIDQTDRFAMETIVNTARTVNSLVSLAQANEAKFLQSITGLCAAAEFSDEMTGQHILRVNRYSEIIARTMGMKKNVCLRIGQVAAIHDIGKVSMPHIIKLERKLDPGERKSAPADSLG